MSQMVRCFIALVWFLFAILGKLYPMTPAHQQIVARVFGEALSGKITTAIGIGELFMALWILSGIHRRLCGWLQIGAVVMMNIIELTIAEDLLLWGYLNGLFALMFVITVYFNMVAPKHNQSS